MRTRASLSSHADHFPGQSGFFVDLQETLGIKPSCIGVCFNADPEPSDEAGSGTGKLTTEPIVPPSDDPSNLPTDPNELDKSDDNYGLKNALVQERDEKKKQREARLEAEKQAEILKKTIQQYEQYGNPEEVQKAMEAVKRQAEHEEAMRKQISEANKKAEETFRPLLEEANQKYEKEKQLRIEGEKRTAIERWFNRPEVAGVGSEFENFYSLTQNNFVYDPEKHEIIEVLDREGKTLYAEGKAASPADLMAEIRKGTWGRSLSSCFEPYQRSSGSGIPATDYRGTNKAQYEGMTAVDKMSIAFQNSRRA